VASYRDKHSYCIFILSSQITSTKQDQQTVSYTAKAERQSTLAYWNLKLKLANLQHRGAYNATMQHKTGQF